MEKIGLKPDNYVGMSAFEMHKDYGAIRDILTRTYRGEEVSVDIETGKRTWGVNTIPLKDRHGKVIRVFATAVDVSERYKTEETLRRESKLLRTLMDNIPDTIYFKDLKSRFTRINKAQAKVLNVKDPDDANGKRTRISFRVHMPKTL